MSTTENNRLSRGQFIDNSGSGLKAANSVGREQFDVLISLGDGIVGKLLRGPTPDKRFSFFLLVPALIAFGISSYLSYVSFTASDVLGCGSGVFDCEHVFQSKYSKWMGIPVSLMATGTYLVMLIALSAICFSRGDGLARRISWAFVAICGISAGIAALWFIGVQAIIIGHYCPWCLGAHLCGLIIATTIFIKRPFGTKQTFACTGIASLALAVLVTGQITATEPDNFKIIEYPVEPVIGNEGDTTTEEGDSLFSAPMEMDGSVFEAPDDGSARHTPQRRSLLLPAALNLFSSTAMVAYSPLTTSAQEEGDQEQEEGNKEQQEPEETRRVVTIPGNVKLDPRQWPLLGSPKAKHIFVEMFDYACPHCRATHGAIKGACETMGEDVAVIVLPVPLNSACNSAIGTTRARFSESCKVAKLAVACWRVDPAKFQEFHHWMFEGATAPSYATAKEKVDSLVGQKEIDEELRKETAGKYIAKHVELYIRAGKGVVPKLMFPRSSVIGEYTSTSSLVEMIKEKAK